MLTIINEKTDPLYNLALEEYVFKQLTIDDDFLLVWQSTNSVVIGRNQNAFRDINGPFIQDNNIPLLRRITSGSAAFHDLGTINYSFIVRNIKDNYNNYEMFLEPVIQLLRKFGVNANIRNNSDIYCDGHKISENTQSFYKNKIIHHGTIFFNVNLDLVTNCLSTPFASEIVTFKPDIFNNANIQPYLSKKISIEKFKNALIDHLIIGLSEEKIYKLDYIDQTRIMSLVREKYKSWDWNYGESPEFIVKKEYDYRMMVTLLIKEGYIKDISIDSYESTIKLEKALLGVKYDETAIMNSLTQVPKIDVLLFTKTLLY